MSSLLPRPSLETSRGNKSMIADDRTTLWAQQDYRVLWLLYKLKVVRNETVRQEDPIILCPQRALQYAIS